VTLVETQRVCDGNWLVNEHDCNCTGESQRHQWSKSLSILRLLNLFCAQWTTCQQIRVSTPIHSTYCVSFSSI